MCDGTIGGGSFDILSPVIGDTPSGMFNRKNISTVPLVTVESLSVTELIADPAAIASYLNKAFDRSRRG